MRSISRELGVMNLLDGGSTSDNCGDYEESHWNQIAKYIIKEKSSPSKFRRLINQIERAKFECENPLEEKRKKSLMSFLKRKINQKKCVDTV